MQAQSTPRPMYGIKLSGGPWNQRLDLPPLPHDLDAPPPRPCRVEETLLLLRLD